MSADIVRFSESSMCETASSAFLPASPVEILNRRKRKTPIHIPLQTDKANYTQG